MASGAISRGTVVKCTAATQESSIFLTVLLLIWYTVSKAGPTNITVFSQDPSVAIPVLQCQNLR